VVEIKFCGLTRAGDVRQAALLGARYAGVILTESPRRVTDAAAAVLLSTAPESVLRVGVF
jgi:phosphoribosylanthranilate isomerase